MLMAELQKWKRPAGKPGEGAGGDEDVVTWLVGEDGKLQSGRSHPAGVDYSAAMICGWSSSASAAASSSPVARNSGKASASPLASCPAVSTSTRRRGSG